MTARTARSKPRHVARDLTALAVVTVVVLLAFAVGPRPAAAVSTQAFLSTQPSTTGVLVSRSAFPTGAPAVVLVNEARWQDMLALTPFAAAADAPILPVPSAGLPSAVTAELKRLAPARAYLVGSAAPLPSAIATQVASALPTGTVERLSAPDSISLTNLLAEKLRELSGSAPPRAYVVNAGNYPDALACAGVAAAERAPVVAITPSRRADVIASMRSVGVTEVVIVGETAAVPASIESSLVAEFGRASVRRLRGASRDTLGLSVAADAARRGTIGWSSPVVASGWSPTELLVGSTLAGRRSSPLLMFQPGVLSDAVANTLWTQRSSVARVAFVGSVPARVRTEATFALRAPAFSSANVMRHVGVLTRRGPRTAGSTADRVAADYAASQLRSFGYAVRFQTVRLPNGRTTRNVIAERRGTSTQVIVVGAHIDSKAPSPGGNDNGSGVATMLELARCVAKAPVAPTIRFIAFGGEESTGTRPDDHHFGSRQYVRSLSASQRARIQSMVSLDMVGYGSRFTVRSSGWAKLTCVGSIKQWSGYTADPVRYERDTSRYGQSDHEAFERIHVPSAWIEWRPDYAWHTRSDTASHVSSNRVRRTGRLTRSWLLKLTPAQLDALR